MIYIVYGDTGEYADQQEWLVAAYTDKAEAEFHAERAQMVVNLYQEAEPSSMRWGHTKRFKPTGRGWSMDETHERWVNPYDPWMKCDYTGTHYGIHEVPTAGDHITAAQKPRKGE